MPFNPCGRVVDFLRTGVTDLVKPFNDSDLLVRRRWYKAPAGAPTLGFPTAFTSNHWTSDPYLPRNVGEVYPSPVSYTRRGTPAGLRFDHICGTRSDFEIGATFNPAVRVVYDDEWIPTCCRGEDVCTTQLCGQEQVNDRPAAQLWSYPINHQDATDTTPVTLEQWAQALSEDTPNSPGHETRWYPLGVAQPPAAQDREIYNADEGFATFQRLRSNAVGSSFTEVVGVGGVTWQVDYAGGSGVLAFAWTGSQFQLTGDNWQLNPANAQALEPRRTEGTVIAAGTTQAGAAPITTSNTTAVTGAAGRGVRLPATQGAVLYVRVPLNALAFNLYPPVGESINALATNAPFDLGAGIDRVYECVRFFNGTGHSWTVKQCYP